MRQRPVSLAGMPITTPFPPAPLRRCWHCTSFAGLMSTGSHIQYCRTAWLSVHAASWGGCALWQREVGADDEPGPLTANGVRSTLQATVSLAPVAWAP